MRMLNLALEHMYLPSLKEKHVSDNIILFRAITINYEELWTW
jgi:hypothetical protein